MEDRLHRRRRQALHFEVVRHSEMECVQGCDEHHYDLQQIGGPLTDEEFNLGSSLSGVGFDLLC